MNNAAGIWVAQFQGQMLVCGLLAKALYGQPDSAWLGELLASRVFDAVPFGQAVPEVEQAQRLLGAWAREHPEGLDDGAIEALVGDHTRLFIGPGKLLAAPWESSYVNRDRALFQLETAAVKEWYQRFDLALASSYNEPADHVGLEFAFLAHLAALTIEASTAHDGEEVKRLIDAQRSFIGQHPSRWIAQWADDVERHARTGWYRGLARLALGVLLEMQSFFAVSLPRVPKSGPFRVVAA
jgi:putative dimethyl sulfoxide reductase chaperone